LMHRTTRLKKYVRGMLNPAYLEPTRKIENQYPLSSHNNTAHFQVKHLSLDRSFPGSRIVCLYLSDPSLVVSRRLLAN
jgi:hypothetical protein